MEKALGVDFAAEATGTSAGSCWPLLTAGRRLTAASPGRRGLERRCCGRSTARSPSWSAATVRSDPMMRLVDQPGVGPYLAPGHRSGPAGTVAPRGARRHTDDCWPAGPGWPTRRSATCTTAGVISPHRGRAEAWSRPARTDGLTTSEQILATVRLHRAPIIPHAQAHLEHADGTRRPSSIWMRELGLFGLTIPASTRPRRVPSPVRAGRRGRWPALDERVRRTLHRRGHAAAAGTGGRRSLLPRLATGEARRCLRVRARLRLRTCRRSDEGRPGRRGAG